MKKAFSPHHQINGRVLYAKQSVHSLIIDTSKPSDDENFGKTIFNSLDNFFSLACSLTGPSRMSYFSFISASSYTELFLPLQRVNKMFYGRILSTLHEMNTMHQNTVVDADGVSDVRALGNAIRETCQDYAKLKEQDGTANQLEITIFTNRSKTEVRSSAREMFDKINLSGVKNIEFISFARPIFSWSQQLMDECIIQTDQSSEITGMWTVVDMECNETCVEGYLKKWLRDESTDSEHLHLHIGDLTLKCDVQERMLNPNELPFGSFLHFGLAPKANAAHGSRAGTKVEATPISHLKVLEMLPMASLCDSIIFGHAVIIGNSSCWQMDWDDLEDNQNNFNALCARLVEEDSCVLCENVTRTTGRQKNNSQVASIPKAKFVLMPSKSSPTLLLKSITTKELFLPFEEISLDANSIPTNAHQSITLALRTVGQSKSFNPLEYESGLYRALKVKLQQRPSYSIQSKPVSARGSKS